MSRGAEPTGPWPQGQSLGVLGRLARSPTSRPPPATRVQGCCAHLSTECAFEDAGYVRLNERPSNNIKHCNGMDDAPTACYTCTCVAPACPCSYATGEELLAVPSDVAGGWRTMCMIGSPEKRVGSTTIMPSKDGPRDAGKDLVVNTPASKVAVLPFQGHANYGFTTNPHKFQFIVDLF